MLKKAVIDETHSWRAVETHVEDLSGDRAQGELQSLLHHMRGESFRAASRSTSRLTSGLLPSRIGFAVPVDIVNRVVPEIIKFGRVMRPGLGVSIANDRIAERLGIDGVLLINIQPDSAAETAGLQGTRRIGNDIILGDIIESVNDEAVSSYDDLRNEFDKYRVGDEVTLGIIRDERHIRVRVRLEQVE